MLTATRDEFFLGMCVGNGRMATGLRKLFLRPGSDANLPVGLTDVELHFSAQKFQQRDRFRGGEDTADTQRPQLGTFEQDLLFIIAIEFLDHVRERCLLKVENVICPGRGNIRVDRSRSGHFSGHHGHDELLASGDQNPLAGGFRRIRSDRYTSFEHHHRRAAGSLLDIKLRAYSADFRVLAGNGKRPRRIFGDTKESLSGQQIDVPRAPSQVNVYSGPRAELDRSAVGQVNEPLFTDRRCKDIAGNGMPET